MPWNVSERAGRRLPVQARATGGYDVAQRPDPNDPVARLKAGFVAAGDPRQQANVAQLKINADQGDQFEAAKDQAYAQQMHDEGKIDTVGHVNMGSMNRTRNSQSSWAPFLQALKDQGVGGLATGAARGMQEPGFFDNPRPSMQGLQQAAETGYGASTWDRKQDQIRRRI